MEAFEIIAENSPAFLAGLSVTAKLTGIAWFLGLLLGGLVGAAAHYFPVSIGLALRIIAFAMSAIPLLVLLYWLHFPVQVALGIVVDPFWTAVLLFSTLNIVAVGEIWRGALDDVRKEHIIAALVCGLTRKQTMLRIQIPLAFRQALPMLLGAQVFILQSTLFSSLISVDELFRVAQRINATIYKPIEIYTGLAIFFAAICLPLYSFAYYLRRRYVRDHSER